MYLHLSSYQKSQDGCRPVITGHVFQNAATSFLNINGCDNWDFTTVTHDHAHDQSKLSCANLVWSHTEEISFPPTFLNSLQCCMQVCSIQKPSWWQGSTTATKRHSKRSGGKGLPCVSEGRPKAAETNSSVYITAIGMAQTHRNPEQPTTITNIYLTDYSWFTCKSVPSRTAGHSTVHNYNAQDVLVCLLQYGLYFYRT